MIKNEFYFILLLISFLNILEKMLLVSNFAMFDSFHSESFLLIINERNALIFPLGGLKALRPAESSRRTSS